MKDTKYVDISVYQKAKVGNYYCGDSYYYYENDDFFICALADGLGSGEMAKESSQAVMNVIEANPIMDTSQIVQASNQALMGKRGVVLGVLKINYKDHYYTYASIGNIGLMTITSDTIKSRNIPMSGYLGVYARTMKEVRGPLERGTMFALFSDGIVSRDLSHTLFRQKDVQDITYAFAEKMEQVRDDDTTLIIIKY